ncbi:MAG TPA: aminotransferase class I/II-fold pyridoxal phosphate-dependent enzyme [Paracoccaceae bacterium]|nr:aminotransferase class I/II-fold pyridoxal phosphate-dependent enzyme [Paracoccaceae bacterium]
MSLRDHGGGIDAAAARWGGRPEGWLDLSTGINPLPYPLPPLAPEAWTRLPDRAAVEALESAARRFWQVPESHGIVAAPGASALIQILPRLAPPGIADIPGPTYNEHEAAFRAAAWRIGTAGAIARVLVNPNNPDGRTWESSDLLPPPGLTIVDESFADASLGAALAHGSQITLKSFGKFWGLAGLRLGFAIAPRPLAQALAELLGPWPVSGPALAIGSAALADLPWAECTRARLARDAARLDALVLARGARLAGGTPLFRLYEIPAAPAWFENLARAHILVRRFPWSETLLRFGLPGPEAAWTRLAAALETLP